jgi:hypothetical protein
VHGRGLAFSSSICAVPGRCANRSAAEQLAEQIDPLVRAVRVMVNDLLQVLLGPDGTRLPASTVTLPQRAWRVAVPRGHSLNRLSAFLEVLDQLSFRPSSIRALIDGVHLPTDRVRYDHSTELSSLTDDDWAWIKPLIPPARRGRYERTVVEADTWSR